MQQTDPSSCFLTFKSFNYLTIPFLFTYELLFNLFTLFSSLPDLGLVSYLFAVRENLWLYLCMCVSLAVAKFK